MNIALANRRAVGWFFAGLLCTTVLVNIAAFVSPLWAELRYGANAASGHEGDLTVLARKAAVWLSLLFVFGAWEVGRTFSSITLRAALVTVSVLTISWPIYHSIAPSANQNPFVDQLVRGFAYLTFLVCVWRVWKTIPIGNSVAHY